MIVKIQPVFNKQKWVKEKKYLDLAAKSLKDISNNRVEIHWLPSIYSEFDHIDFVNFFSPMNTGDTPEFVSPTWYQNNIYSLNREADHLVFVSRKDEWEKNESNGYTYGYTTTHTPTTAPNFISMMVEDGDKSWKFRNRFAFEHYLVHELAHDYSNLADTWDRTHEFDYTGRLKEFYDLLDFKKVEETLKKKRKLDGQMANFYYKDGDPTIYADVEGKFVGFSTDEGKLRADWPTAKFIKLAADELLKVEMANHHTLAKRQ